MLVIRPIAETTDSSTAGRWMSEDGRYLILRSDRGRHWHLQGQDSEAAKTLIDAKIAEEFRSRQAAAEALAQALGERAIEVSNTKIQLPLLLVPEQSAPRPRQRPLPAPPAASEQLTLSLEGPRAARSSIFIRCIASVLRLLGKRK